MQESWLRLNRARPDTTDAEKLRHLLLVTVRHTALNMRRSRLAEPAEIALEIVDLRDRSVENPAVRGAVHQDRLGAEHLRDFRQDSCSSLCYQKVGKDTQQRIGRNTGESIRSSAFLSYAQLTLRIIRPFIL